MTLTLAIQDAGRLGNGAPAELTLDRRGAVVGRASSCDWSLPDPAKHISARHFEVTFDGRGYLLSDISTNGTFVNGASERLKRPHRIAQGDRIQVGPYLIHASLRDAAEAVSAVAAPRGWAGWDSDGDGARSEPGASDSGWSTPVGSAGWDAAPVQPRGNARWQPEIGPSLARPEAHRSAPRAEPQRTASNGWAPTAAAPLPPVASAWESAAPNPDPASGWSSAAPDRPAAPSPDDVWGRIAEGNVVDWARGGFGQPSEPARDPLGLNPAPASAALPEARPVAPAAPPPPVVRNAGGAEFFEAAGIAPASIDDPATALARAGALFHKLVAGLVVMVEARARAKAQLGAEATAFSPQGHNPLKFARTPDEALAMLIEPPQRGFMPADRAIEDAFLELQSHQMATLKAMQGALRATLDRFSPTAIRARANDGGMLERILPAARDAALWQAYEREFGGVAQGSDEAFMDVFAKEFRRAYNDQARRDI